MVLILHIIQIFLFSCALSVDSFAAGLSYSAEGIKIPKSSAFVISGICAVVTSLGIGAGKLVNGILPQRVILALSSAILLGLSFIKFFEFSIKICVKKNNTKKDFYFLNFHFLLEIMCDTTQADADKSKVLSVKEAYALAVALSLDGFVAGISGGLSGLDWGLVLVLTFITGITAIFLGGFSGKRIAEKAQTDLSWISGAILFVLAIMKMKP